MIIREKQELSEKSEFCLFASNCHASMNRDAQSGDHMLNRQTAHARWLKQNVSIILINFAAVSMRQGVDFFSE